MGEEDFLSREKLLGQAHYHLLTKKGPLVIILALIILDLAFLNYKILSLTPPLINQSSTKIEALPSAASQAQQNICPESCVSQINSAFSSIQAEEKTTKTISQSGSSVKEYYVPLGSGVNSSDEWQDVSGLDAYIDPSSYGSIKKITFEASIHIPSGNETAEVRLLNVTKGHIVWGSEMVFTGGGKPQLLTSQPLTLDPGSNLYRIQMKTQLKYPAYLDQARVHITTY